MDYVFGLAPRVVTLALRPLDAYTGKTPQGAYVSLAGAAPIVKPDGYFVYTNLPGGSHSVTAGASGLFERTLRLSGSRVITDLLLIPDGSRYPLNPGASYLTCETGQSSTRFWGAPSGSDVQLSTAYEPGSSFIEINRMDYDFEGRFLAVHRDNSLSDVFRLGERVGERKYALKKTITQQYDSNTPLLPLSFGKTDANGCLLMPLWRSSNAAMAVLYDACGTLYKTVDIKHFSKG